MKDKSEVQAWDQMNQNLLETLKTELIGGAGGFDLLSGGEQ